MSSEYVIEMSHIDKQFGGVYALKDVSLLLKKGTVLALLGENGAGKSTLMKILTGVITKDGGTVKMNGGGNRSPQLCGSTGYGDCLCAAGTCAGGLFYSG